MAKKIVATALSEFEYSADFYDVSTELSARYGLYERNVDILARRAFDIVASFFGCLVVLPVMLFVKLGNMLTGDFKPIFLKQSRLGKDGKVFNLLKFRSMVMLDDGRQADALLEELFEKNPEKMLKAIESA